MKCFNPYFKFEIGRGALPFPCGCCPACRAQKSLEWSLRMYLESTYYNDIAFITLTYAPEFLPENGSLSPAHLQGFFKRLRRKIDYKIRYFACGEYGDKFGRAHYHAIIYGLKQDDWLKVYESWGKGRVECEKPSFEAFKYVAGYVNKKIGRQREWKEKNPDLYPMFQRCSLGLGLKFILEKVHVFTNTLIIGNKRFYIGRYLRNKLAEKLGVLAQIKENGLNILQAQTESLISEFYHYADKKTLQVMEEIKKLYGLGAFLSSLWFHKYEGAQNEYLAQMKLRQQKYRRGEYDDKSAIDRRVRRVFS